MTHSFLAYPFGSTLESSPFVLDAEYVTIRAVLDVMKNAVLLSLPVLTAVGLKLLKDTKENINDKQAS